MLIPVPESIETERLRLRRHRRDDEKAFLAFMTDENATRFLLFTKEERSLHGARERFEKGIMSYAGDDPVFTLTIADKATDEFVGACALDNVRGEPDAREVFYDIIPAAQGKGYATEACRALVDYAIAAGVKKLIAFLMLENAGAVRVAEHLGFEDHGPAMKHGRSGRRFVLQAGK